jgi:prepilin-type N-terminal cleavage/methylation domain-containing protein
MRKGFTLIELLLSVSIIAVLAAIVITAVNPAKQLGDAEDGRRRQSINQLEKALTQYFIDKGEFPGNPSILEEEENALPICRAGFAEEGGSCVNLDMLLSHSYLSCLPHDGLEADPDQSGYTVFVSSGRVRINALYLGAGSGGGSCESLPQPVAYWKLDETSIGETVLDSSGNGRDGTHNGINSPEGPHADTPGTVFANSRSLRIDQGDYVDVGNFNIPGTKLTLSSWFKADQFLYDPRMVDKAEGPSLDGVYWMLGINDSSTTDGTVRFRVYTDQGGATTLEGGAVVPDVWTHIAGTYDGSTMKLYKDGTEIATVAKAGSIRTGVASVWLGANPPDVWNRKHDGFLDDVRVYNAALKAGQILSLALGNP